MATATVLLGLLASCSSDDGASATSVAADCVPAHQIDTLEEGVLKVAVAPALPYIEIEDGKLTGLEGVVLEKFAEQECLTIEAQRFPGSAGALSSLESGRSDLLTGGWFLTPERENSQVYGHTDAIYYDFTAFVSANGTDRLEDVDGPVAVGSGQLWTEQIQSVLGDDRVKQFQSTAEVYQEVASGRTSVAVMGYGEAANYALKARGGDLRIEPAASDPKFPSSLAINAETMLHDKANTGLTSALDATIEALRADGTVEAALETYGLTDPLTFDGPA